jgi:hypothetical protein
MPQTWVSLIIKISDPFPAASPPHQAFIPTLVIQCTGSIPSSHKGPHLPSPVRKSSSASRTRDSARNILSSIARAYDINVSAQTVRLISRHAEYAWQTIRPGLCNVFYKWFGCCVVIVASSSCSPLITMNAAHHSESSTLETLGEGEESRAVRTGVYLVD